MLRRDVYRLNAKDLASDSASPIQSFPAFLTKVGIFVYSVVAPDGTVTVSREYRPAEEVFAADSLASLRAVPLVEGHPAEVTPENYSALVKGHVGDDVRADGIHVASTIHVGDKAIQNGIASGDLVELSCAYRAILDPTPGVYEGEPYDAIQRGLRYNHVGIGGTDWGRAGNNVKVFADSGITHEDSMQNQKIAQLRMDNAAAPPKADGTAGTPSPLVHSIDILGLVSEKEKLAKELAEANAKVTALEAQATANAAQAATVNQETMVADAAKEVLGLIEEAKALGIDATHTDSAQSIRAKVLAKLSPSTKLDGKTADQVRDSYEVATAAYAEATKGAAKGKAAEATAKADGATKPKAKADSTEGEDTRPYLIRAKEKQDSRGKLPQKVKA